MDTLLLLVDKPLCNAGEIGIGGRGGRGGSGGTGGRGGKSFSWVTQERSGTNGNTVSRRHNNPGGRSGHQGMDGPR